MLWMMSVMFGCGTNNAVFERYQVAKRQALAAPSPVSSTWSPDLRIELSPPLLDRLIKFGLEQNGQFRSEVDFSVGKATPTLEIDSVRLGESDRCESCFVVDLDLSGDITWRAGLLGKGTVPATAKVRLDVELETKKAGSKWLIRGLPRDVRQVSLQVPGWSGAVRRAASAPLEQWLNSKVEAMQPVTLTKIGGEDLPLLAVEVKPNARGLSILALSTAPSPGLVNTKKRQVPKQGFAVWVGYNTLVSFAAAKAFEEGPQAYDVVAIPTALSSKKSGFTLGLRLWGLGGRGWWRDYSANGAISIIDGEVRLKPVSVKQLKASRNAIAADPLAYLAEGIILDSMSDAMQVSLPNVYDSKLGTSASSTKITSIRGESDGLRVAGDVHLRQFKGKGTKRRR